MNAPIKQLRDHSLQLTVANQRIAADQGKMQRFKAVDQFQNTVDQCLTFAIMQVAQHGSTAQMCVIIRITSGTAERTLAGDLYRERRTKTLQDPPPCSHDFGCSHKCYPCMPPA